jgi:hemoglobin-like flavoprotein
MSALKSDPGNPARRSPHQLAQQSYSRCLRSPGFLPRFYEHLLASDPGIPPRFANTEFPRQNKLLQHGLGLLLSYGNKPDPALLERIAARHSKRALDVPPSLYALFVDSLLAAIREYDSQYTPQIETAWREALAPGIEFMQARYDS